MVQAHKGRIKENLTKLPFLPSFQHLSALARSVSRSLKQHCAVKPSAKALQCKVHNHPQWSPSHERATFSAPLARLLLPSLMIVGSQIVRWAWSVKQTGLSAMTVYLEPTTTKLQLKSAMRGSSSNPLAPSNRRSKRIARWRSKDGTLQASKI